MGSLRRASLRRHKSWRYTGHPGRAGLQVGCGSHHKRVRRIASSQRDHGSAVKLQANELRCARPLRYGVVKTQRQHNRTIQKHDRGESCDTPSGRRSRCVVPPQSQSQLLRMQSVRESTKRLLSSFTVATRNKFCSTCKSDVYMRSKLWYYGSHCCVMITCARVSRQEYSTG